MFTEIQTSLQPLIATGVLFFTLIWLTNRRWLALGVLGLSMAEIAPTLPWAALSQTPASQIQIQLLDTFATAAAGGASQAGTLLINAALAALIWVSIRRLQRWARATVARHEAAFLALIERDARNWNAGSSDI